MGSNRGSNMERMNRLYLHIPRLEELDYRQKILLQPDTMSYNKGFHLQFIDYDNETGCIYFRKQDWKSWFDFWINQGPDRFYAYIVKREDHQFIGEVSFRYDKHYEAHMVGIIIEAQHRGKGYCEEALNLLVQVAFDIYGLERLQDDIPAERETAHKAFAKVGFKKKRVENGNILVELVKK